jgi:outer membrane protein TolC
MARLTALAAFLTLALPSLAAAQGRLTLAQAVGEALDRNPSLGVAAAARDRASAEADVQHAAAFPQVSWSESWLRSNQPVFAFGSLLNARQFTVADFAVDRLNRPDARAAFTNRIAIRQLLFDGGARRSATDAARGRRDAADASLDQARADLVLAVTRLYGQVLSAQAATATIDAAVTAAEEDLARATRRRDAGTVTDADVLAMAVQMSGLRQQAIQARGQAAIARAELNRLAGAPVDRSFLVEEPALTDEPTGDLPALFAEAERARPELRRAAAAETQARAAARQARAGWLPSVAAHAGYELNGLAFDSRASSWVAGGEIRWDLSLGGATAAATRAATATVAGAEAAQADARAAVQVDVVTAVQHLDAARARARVGRDAVAQAQERRRIVRNRYDAGVIGANDVLAATTAALEAEAQRVGAVVDLLVAHAELQHALGRPASSSR